MIPKKPPEKIDPWGIAKCTICRLWEAWRDQSQETGHADRHEDLDLIAGLGVPDRSLPYFLGESDADLFGYALFLLA